MDEILVYLTKIKRRTNFIDLFPYTDKESIVVTFLAILELMKTKEIIVEQEQNFTEIFLSTREIFDNKQVEVYA
jgi:segregation and condensation protein A